MERSIRAPILVFSRGNAGIARPWVLIGSYRNSPCVPPRRASDGLARVSSPRLAVVFPLKMVFLGRRLE